MPILSNFEQGSEEWYKVRAGRITGSRITHVMAYLKSGKGEMACRRDYRLDLIAERLTGICEDNFVTREMQWGKDHEAEARAAYEMWADTLVEPIGFAIHPTMDFTGASPDSLVGNNGILEIKCPKTTTHLDWMMAGVVPEEHRDQMLWEMACCEREYGDFVSYDPRISDESLRLFVSRLKRDDRRIAEITAEVMKFNAEIETSIGQLRAAYTIAA